MFLSHCCAPKPPGPYRLRGHCQDAYVCGYHEPGATSRSVRSALENGSDLWDDDEAPFGLVDSAEKIWEWLQGPVVQLAYTDANNTCVFDK